MAVKRFKESSVLVDKRYQSMLVGNVGYQPYWMSTVDTRIGGVAVDSNKNVYTVGAFLTGASDRDTYTMKINERGAFQWAYKMAFAGDDYLPNNPMITVDSSGNIVTGSSSANDSNWYIYSLNSSGTLQWQKTTSNANANLIMQGYDFSSGYILGYGTWYIGANYKPYTFKWNSNGSINQTSYWNSTGANFNGQAGCVLSNGDMVVGGGENAGNTTSVWKWTGTGNGWTKTYSLSQYPRAMKSDSLDNIYVATEGGVLFKINSSGTTLWQKSSGTGGYAKQIFISGSSMYVLYRTTVSTRTAIQVTKYDLDGNIQWQRQVTNSTYNLQPQGIFVDSSGNMYISSWINNNTASVIMKLPADGSLTGTYTVNGFTFVYGTSSYSTTTTTYSEGTVNGSATTGSLTNTDWTATRGSITPSYTAAALN
jgi:hypothetical protein